MRIETAAPQRVYSLISEGGETGIVLSLHPGQEQAWDSLARFVFMISGTQGGKTVFGPWWLHREIARLGPGDYIAATATYDLFKLKMLPSMLEVFVHVLGIARYWSGDQVLELCVHDFDNEAGVWAPRRGEYLARKASDPMWGRVLLRSASSKGGLESATAKAAWLDECGQDDFTLAAWEAVLRRLSLSRGRVLGTTTPYNLGWLKQRVYDAWVRGDPDYDVIQFASIVNPAFPIEEYEDRQATMDDWKFRMFYRGEFERLPGLIYSAFVNRYREEGGHKVRPFQLHPLWPRYIGIDPGGVNTAKVWLAYNEREDVYYLYREDLSGQMSTPEHAQDIITTARAGQERIHKVFIGQIAEGQVRRDYRAAGLHGVAEPNSLDVESGIDRVVRLWKQNRLFVFDTCYRLLDELGTYRRELDDMGQPKEKIHRKETYHMLDALRYAAAGITGDALSSVKRVPTEGMYPTQERLTRNVRAGGPRRRKLAKAAPRS